MDSANSATIYVGGTAGPTGPTIADLIAWQSRSGGCFACRDCRHYAGRLICERGVFIAFEGANMSDCSAYETERRRPQGGS